VTYSLGEPPAALAGRIPWQQQSAYSADEPRAKRQDGIAPVRKARG
jgi:hypothetical protein